MVDFQKIEAKWQKKWEDKRIFESNPSKQDKYFVAIPYPYTSGPFHIGHGRTYATADIFTRYHIMKGENVLWPMGFHVTGTPVLAISQKIKNDDWKTMQMFKDYISLHTKDPKEINKILSSFSEPKNVMSYFAETFRQDFKAMGCAIDWRRSFTTTDPEYNKFIEWQFHKLKDSGFITKGKYPVLYCKNCKNAVGEDDIKGGDEIKAKVEEFTVIKFPFGKKYIVAATFRPETIFGATNLWINPRAKYVELNVNNEIWIMSKLASEKFKFQNKGLEVTGEILGKELIGKKAKNPINEKQLPIIEASFVDPNNATGVVYSVPAHAPYDYVALKNSGAKIDMISIIKLEGYGDFPAKEIVDSMGIEKQTETEKLKKATEEIYKSEFYSGVLKENCGKYAGKKISQIKDLLIKDFRKKNLIGSFYEVVALEKPVKCRCGGDVIAAILDDQWFIDYGNTKWKEKARECLKNMEIVPEAYKKQFEDTIEWLHERPCARRRGLGTPLPFNPEWIIESLSDSTIYMAFYTVIHHIRANRIKPEQLTPEFWDYVFLEKGGIKKIEKETGISKAVLKIMHDEFEYWYPLDLRHTGIAHITNHLTFFIFNHVAVFPKKQWPVRITLNELLIREGRKMSKSIGNVIPLVDIPKQYGADLFRLYIAFTADLSTVVDWKESDVLAAKSKLFQFYGIVEEALKSKVSEEKQINVWLRSRFARNIKAATEALDKYNPRQYILHAFYNTINDISYFRRRGGELGSIKDLVLKWIKLLAPIIPHSCEELWSLSGSKNFISAEKWPEPDKKSISLDIENYEELLMNLVADIQSIIKLIGKKPEKITVFTPSEWKYVLVSKAKELKSAGRLQDAMKKIMEIEKVKANGSQASKIITRLMQDPGKIPEFDVKADKEFSLYEESKEYLKKEFNAKIEIIQEKNSKEAKAKQAMPNKPAILVE